jgi:NTE family protein
VVTVRDSVIAWLDLAAFEAVVDEHPRLALRLARHALSRSSSELRGRGVPGTIVLLSASPTVQSDEMAARLGAAPGAAGAFVVVDPDDTVDQVTERLAALEHEDVQVLLPARSDDPVGAAHRVRQADRVLVIVDTGRPETFRPGAIDEVRQVLDDAARDGVDPAVELVLLHPPDTDLPRRTREVLDQFAFVGHHHLRDGDVEHDARIVRHLRGRSVNLVLSGGGARGHAHLGVHRVLVEARCPIDTVAGTSFGALMAAQVADGEPTDVLIERNRSWIGARVGSSVSFPPVISLMSVRRALRVFDELFADRDLEDLWLPCFVAAADLSDGTIRYVDRGPLASMVRASGSPPGLWPPVPDERGHLLVDGGLVDNLPVIERRARTLGPVIAVDVSRAEDMTVDPTVGAVTTLWEFVRSFRSRSPFPTLPKVLIRAMTLVGAARLRDGIEASDLVIRPDVSTITLPEHKRSGEAIAAGDVAARDALGAHPDLVAGWR